jgi:putative flavoprotein involved in K+ transport
VRRLTRGRDERFDVHTDSGFLRARDVVVATGPHGTPRVPAALRTAGVEAGVEVVPSSAYRNPEGLAPGAVLVVGASSSGVQIADELLRAGRRVTIAVGRHTRMPRRYRGMDAFWWLESTGKLARTIDRTRDPHAARREPSLQLVGRNEPERWGQDLDLASLQLRGARLAGRLLGIDGGRARFGQGLPVTVADAEARMHRFLDDVDRYVARAGLAREVLPAERPHPFLPAPGPAELDLAAEGIGSVVLATGFRPDHGWLELPVVDPDGTVRQRRGVTELPGLYVVGQRFQHRRDSGFIDGARHDAHAVVARIAGATWPLETSEEPAA